MSPLFFKYRECKDLIGNAAENEVHKGGSEKQFFCWRTGFGFHPINKAGKHLNEKSTSLRCFLRRKRDSNKTVTSRFYTTEIFDIFINIESLDCLKSA